MNIWHIYDYAAFFIRIQKSEQAQLFLKYHVETHSSIVCLLLPLLCVNELKFAIFS